MNVKTMLVLSIIFQLSGNLFAKDQLTEDEVRTIIRDEIRAKEVRRQDTEEMDRLLDKMQKRKEQIIYNEPNEEKNKRKENYYGR